MNAIQNYHSMGTIPQPIQKHYSFTASIGRRSKSCNATRTTEFSANHRSSLEASSAVSSGYWEDYESLGQSASGSANLACVTRYETPNTATAVRQQPTGLSIEHMPSGANSAYLSENLDSTASNECPSGWRQLMFERRLTNGLQGGSPTDRSYKVLDGEFGPIPKSLSSDMASTYVRSLEDITEASDCQPHSAGNPTANTTPIKTGHLGYADIGIPVMHSSALSFDELSSDSDDELDGTEHNSAPKTQFEAALRRAHLAQKQRKTTSMGLPARHAMPDWGSPIHWSTVQRPGSLGQPQHQQNFSTQHCSLNLYIILLGCYPSYLSFDGEVMMMMMTMMIESAESSLSHVGKVHASTGDRIDNTCVSVIKICLFEKILAELSAKDKMKATFLKSLTKVPNTLLPSSPFSG
ncbi:hypothetical protein CRM22_003066 [Opisthorchis felineus]|uniref:Uncharacterized protein n=1 Tax=Opisthorchis felineus TaxID=147828 RepID=A0A4S2M334_OPIFE|nr:hypothetical protein CRM22_003066 [Opisthorchis felineus]TGZ70684.1 hypothetical protein CRM22_003066 [Opisthorchis felineus]TGZ70685.1 hypothetical protein CRM22_003066 [Opisthorchis felineus]